MIIFIDSDVWGMSAGPNVAAKKALALAAE